VTALYERPALKLVIDAYVDPAADAEAIRRAGLMERLRAQKLALTPAAGRPTEGREDVEVRPDEYAALLRAAFVADGVSRLLGASSRRAGISTDEMEALMLARFTPTEDSLRALAKERADTILATLAASGKIDASRISIGTPETLAPKALGAVKASRVEFRLQ